MPNDPTPRAHQPHIQSWKLDSDGKVREVTWKDGKGEPGPCFWIHLTVTDPDADADFLESAFGLPIGPSIDATHGYIRPGIDHRGGPCSFVLPFISTDADDAKYQAVGFFVSEAHLLTVGKALPPIIKDIQDAWIDDPVDIGPTVSHLVYAIMDANVDGFFPMLDRLQDHIEDLEDRIFENAQLHPTEAIGTKRKLLEARRQLGPIRDVLNAVIRHGPPMIPASLLPDYQDILQHVLRLTDSIDLGRDILSSIMDAQLGVVSNRLNEVMRVLTVVSTLMMASSLIAGIYGMNFKRIPETDWVYGYPFAIGLMVVVSAIIFYIFKQKKFV